MALGQLLLGVAAAFLVVSSLPEMIDCVQDKYPQHVEQVIDISSGIYTTSIGIAMLTAPLFGSYMTELMGFRYTCDCLAIFCLFYSILYFVVCDGKNSFKYK